MKAKDLNNKIRPRLNRIGRDLSWSMGFGKKKLQSSTGSRILVYHGICLNDPSKFNTLFISLKQFEKQLLLYKKYFNLISLDELYQTKPGNDRFSICLTFDDGFANNYKYVLQLLEKYQVPAVFFINAKREAGYDYLWNDLLSIAGRYGPSEIDFRDELYTRNNYGKYISGISGEDLVNVLRQHDFEARAELVRKLEIKFDFRKHANEDYWLQMSIEQIRTLSQSKWATIGSHSYYHNDLAMLSSQTAYEDMAKSKKFLEGIITKEVSSIAFPYGSHSAETVMQAKKAGFHQILATETLNSDDHKSLKQRFTINPFISPINQMHANISGKYD
jgi:peptidoglycan/xylan/chitin deacetylase (PgdA/CDA1 family)